MILRSLKGKVTKGKTKISKEKTIIGKWQTAAQLIEQTRNAS